MYTFITHFLMSHSIFDFPIFLLTLSLNKVKSQPLYLVTILFKTKTID